jgi:hypothetical protein
VKKLTRPIAKTLATTLASNSLSQTDALFEKGWPKTQPFFVSTLTLYNEYPTHTMLLQ